MSAHGIATTVMIVVLPGAAAAVDLNGKWRFEGIGPAAIVEVTQVGNALTIPWVVPFTGTVGATDAGGFTSYQVSWTDGAILAGFVGRIMPSGNLLDGRAAAAVPPDPLPLLDPVVATRCGCDDGNSANGDGCDDTCQVEPCWTCSGDPSVCSPSADGAACDDRRDCTAGETCAAGTCGGGAPVAPCIDMSGAWNRHQEVPELGAGSDFATAVTQRGGDLRIGAYVGAIDAASGAFDVRAPNVDESQAFCPPFAPLIGSVAGDGLTYAATGSVDVQQPDAPDHCLRFDLSETGTRCGSATIELTESCDDGNLDDGDGCSARCAVEQCWTCGGEPSSCAPAGGGGCDDGDACTANDTCLGSGACSGAPVTCAACLQCDPSAGCVPQPRSPCKSATRPARSNLALRDRADDRKDRLAWRWLRGEATVLAELGDPPGGDGYAVCVYGDSVPAPLLFRAVVPGGGTCRGRPCWRPTHRGDGFVYRDADGRAEGVVLIELRSGAVAKSRVAGKGPHLSDRPAGLPVLPLPLPLRVQLQGGNGLCLETRHDVSGTTRNDALRGVFRARGVP